jgi:hypothetical protein
MKSLRDELKKLLEDQDTSIHALRDLAERWYEDSGELIDESIHQVLVDDPELLADWWARFGQDAISALFPARKYQKGVVQSPGSRPRGIVKRPSWRDSLELGPDGFWGLIIPIGNTGRTKRFGDFDRNDVAEVESAYRDDAKKMMTRAEFCGRIKRTMGPTDTLEGMAKAGRLREEEIDFLGARLDDIGMVEVIQDGAA